MSPASADPRARASRASACIGVADTTFARVDMGGVAMRTIEAYAAENGVDIKLVRRTVPGFKDLPVACKKLIDEQRCDLVVALGQAGPAPIDKQCAHEASMGLQQAMLMTNTHVLEVFLHTDEVPLDQPARLRWLGENRAREHALNACWMLFEPDRLTKLAGTGQREGFEDEGAIDEAPRPPRESGGTAGDEKDAAGAGVDA